MKDNPNLCLSIRKRIHEKGKAIEVWVCDGGWHQQWKWHTQGAGLYGYVSDGYQGDWCLDREGKDHKIRVGDRLESKKCKSGKGRQLFYRDGLNRLVNMQGLCLEVEGNFHEANVNLRTCSNNSYQFWKFVKKSSFPPPPPPLPRLEPRSSSRLVPSTSRYSCFVGLTEAIKVQSCKQTAEYRWSWDGHKLKALGSGKCLVFRTPTSGGSGWKSLAKLNNKLGPREVVLQPCRSAPNLEIRKIRYLYLMVDFCHLPSYINGVRR